MMCIAHCAKTFNLRVVSVFFVCDQLSLRGIVVQIQYLMQSLTLGAVIKQISYLTPDLGPTTIIYTRVCDPVCLSVFDCYCKISWICGLPVETVCEGLPQLDVVPPFACIDHNETQDARLNSIKLTFIIETIDAVDGGTLVVSSQQEKVLRVLKQQIFRNVA